MGKQANAAKELDEEATTKVWIVKQQEGSKETNTCLPGEGKNPQIIDNLPNEKMAISSSLRKVTTLDTLLFLGKCHI